MPRALFTSKNLIGDGISISPALRAWHREHPDYEIDLLTLPDHAECLYSRMGVPVNVVTDEKKLLPYDVPYDFEHVFDVNAAFALGDKEHIHIIDAYAKLLGVTTTEIAPTYIPNEEDHPKGLILISPFSRSCASRQGKPPNKMLPWNIWSEIMSIIRCYGDIGVLGGPSDRAPLPIFENEYYCGQSINYVALLLRDAKALVTIDNGMCHLATSQATPILEFYPACLGLHWVAPRADNAFVAQVNPAEMVTMPELTSRAIMIVNQGLRHLLG